MASLAQIVESSGWKKFMAKLYGWGASVVIVGALFKIQHWKYSGLFLTVGLLTEAVIFFFSAFEPLKEEIDWTLVYPELAGVTDQEGIDEIRQFDNGYVSRPVERFDGAAMAAIPQVSMDEKAMKNLGDSIQKLGIAAGSIADLSGATVVTKEFVTNLKNASGSVGAMNSAYNETIQSIKSSADSLASAYSQSAEQIVKSGGEVTDSYLKIAETIKSEHQVIAQSGQVHEQHLEALNKILSALNAVYELHVKEGSDHLKGAQQVYSGIEDMILRLKDSIDETNKYKEEVVKLRENLSSLNGIYGNMLSAMNVIVNK